MFSQVHDVQYLSVGETSVSRQPLPATMYYRLIGGTKLCVVLVHLHVDSKDAENRKQLSNVSFHYVNIFLLSNFDKKPFLA